MTGDLLTLQEAAELAGVPVQVINRWIDHGHVPYSIVDATIRVPRAELLAMLDPGDGLRGSPN